MGGSRCPAATPLKGSILLPHAGNQLVPLWHAYLGVPALQLVVEWGGDAEAPLVDSTGALSTRKRGHLREAVLAWSAWGRCPGESSRGLSGSWYLLTDLTKTFSPVIRDRNGA